MPLSIYFRLLLIFAEYLAKQAHSPHECHNKSLNYLSIQCESMRIANETCDYNSST